MKSEGNFQIRNDWIINNRNIFCLEKDISLSLSSIQYEIMNQLKDKNINSIFEDKKPFSKA